MIQRHPVTAGLSALAVLVLLAIPLFSMRLAFTDARERSGQPHHPSGV